MNKSLKITLSVIIILIVLFLLFDLINNVSTSNISESINIGVIIPLTGSQAPYGQAIREGLELALQDLRSDRKIELIYEDNQGEVKNSVSAAQKLISLDKVTALITGVSQHSLAVAPIAEENKIVLSTLASHATALNTAGDYIFKNDDDFAKLAKESAKYIFNQDYRSVGLIYALYNDAQKGFASEFQNEFEKLGGKVYLEAFAKEEQDFRSNLLKLDSKNVEVIFIGGLVNDNALILKEIIELGLKQKVFGNSGMEDKQIIDAAKEAAEGIIFFTFNVVPTEAVSYTHLTLPTTPYV